MVRVVSARPATTGDTPSEPSRYMGTNEVSPIRMAPTASPAKVVVSSSRRVSTKPGRIGSAALRAANTNATSSTAPEPNAAKLAGESHSHVCPPPRIANTSSVNPSVSNTALG